MVILTVDDEPFLVELIQEALERDGHTCLTATNVDEAEWVAREVAIDALILDFSMPGRAPLDWLEELALATPELARRTLIVTGHLLDEGLVLRIHGCGAAVLSKPFDIAALAAFVGRLASLPSNPPDGRPPRSLEKGDSPFS